jgi:fibrillarin-like rRNA methylase
LAAAILKGLSVLTIEPGSRVLYLGAASGTTVSHVSDIVGKNGIVYAVEFAQRSFRDLVSNVCRDRSNVTPIFADARLPQKYRSLVSDVECIYCDIAQPDQARILVENAEAFLKSKGSFLIAIKARSIDVAEDPSTIFRQEAEFLKTKRYNVMESVRLDPFELDHAMIRGEKRV